MKKTKHLRIFMAIAVIALAAVLAVPCYSFALNVQAQTLEAQSLVIDENNPLALLNELDATRGVKDVNKEYRLDKVLNVAYGKVYKFRQLYKDMEFFDSELIVTVDDNGTVLDVSGDYKIVSALEDAQISEEEALDIVAPEGYASVKKLVYNKGYSYELAYDVYADGMRYIVSASNGNVILSYSTVSDAVSKEMTDYDGNKVTLPVNSTGTNYTLGDSDKNIFVFDSSASPGKLNLLVDRFTSTTGDDFDPVAVSTYANVLKAYEYYADENNTGVKTEGFGQYLGEDIWICVYVHYQNANGSAYENAACSFYPDPPAQGEGSLGVPAVVMIVGDGKPNNMMYMPGRSLDIIAHEYQHAVTHFASGFVYQADSGALDEAFSDIFGSLIEGKDPTKDDSGFWQIGEDCVNESYGTELRSLIGGTDGQSYALSEKKHCTFAHSSHGSMCDNQYVHANSTIITRIQYELCQEMPEYFTRERIGTLWYSTLCKLKANSTFADFATAFLASAKNLKFDQEAINLITEKANKFTASYKVTFVDYDGTVLKAEQTVKAGESAKAPADPTRASDARADYTFKGWSENVIAVTKDMVAVAEYEEEIHSYNVLFLSADGNELKKVKYFYGDKLVLPTASELNMEEDYPSDIYTVELYSDADLTQKVEAGSEVTSNLILYCKWVKKSDSSMPGKGCGACGTVTFGGTGAGLGGMLLLSVALLPLVLLPISKKKRSK